MATVSAIILKADQKSDGTWNVKIRVWHNKKPAYIDTVHFVTIKQLGKKSKDSKSLVIKDNFILDRIAPDLKEYRDWISNNESYIERSSAKQIRDRLVSLKDEDSPEVIDFLAFCKGFIEVKKNTPKASSARTLQTVYNSLVDYFKSDHLPITEINYNFLKKYETYLSSPRELTRKNHSGLVRTYIQKGVAEAGLHNHMRDLRLLFNEARNEFNDEDLGVMKIRHYPFKKYKVGTAPLTEHRDRTIEEVIKIRDCNLPDGSRAELARDLGMLSLYLLGMNAADLYRLPIMDGTEKRIDYNRAKTASIFSLYAQLGSAISIFKSPEGAHSFVPIKATFNQSSNTAGVTNLIYKKMIIRTILITALNLFALVAYSQTYTPIGKNILVELPQGGTKYVDTASANLLSKNFGVPVSADRLPMNKYSYRAGNLIYQFYEVARVTPKQTRPVSDDIPRTEDRARKKKVINGNTFLIDTSEGNQVIHLRFYSFNEKSGTALKGTVIFPADERSFALQEIEKVFQSVKFSH